MAKKRHTIDILGIPVDDVTMGDALTVFELFLAAEGMSWVATPNAEIISQASADERLRHLLSDADLIIPDGIGLLYASRMLGYPLHERVAGIDFAYRALQHCARAGFAVYFLGGKPGIAESAAENVMRDIPGLVVAGTHHGYFSEGDVESIIADINASEALFLCVALGFPKQEQFLSANRHALQAKVGVGIGGSFDVWAGALKRAPKPFRSLGLEWLYRLAQEPSRISRIVRLPVFLLRVAGQKRGRL